MGGKSIGDGVDFIATKGVVEFKHAETSKNIEITINKNSKVSAYRFIKLPCSC